MKNSNKLMVLLGLMIAFILGTQIQCVTSRENRRTRQDIQGDPDDPNKSIKENAEEMLEKGKAVFRFESFGDEAFWSEKLQLHKAIADK